MRWRVLGPVELVAGGGVPPALRPQQRGVIAYLVLHANLVVTAEALIDAVWGDDPPPSARAQVQMAVSRIRRAVGAGVLVTQAGGYRLAVGDGESDLAVFTALTERARAAVPATAAVLLRDGLGVWRGAPLTGAAGAFVPGAAVHLLERQLCAREDLFDAELALGNHDAAVAGLRPLVEANPLRERLVGLLMLALAGSGQQAEALGVYATTRQRLADELGVEPAADLADVHVRVLRQEVPRRHHTPAVRPAQLPADVPAFAGRAVELQRLDLLLGHAPATVVISAIDGTAGVGKTALAVHWAHRIAHRFADGQLYLNLRGFDPARPPVAPAETVRSFLDALQVPPARVPAGLDAQVALYRSLLAGRRMLLVLDNARDAEQVRPLLPGAPGCLAIVTSRNRLTGLVAAEAAYPLTLDVLPAAEARALLGRRLGAARIAAESDAVGEIIEACAGLPLALAVVAARASIEPGVSLGALAAELRAGLAAFAGADPATDVRGVFSWSYRTLSPAAARLFRLLGLHPGPDFAAPAAASLAGRPVVETTALLAELSNAHLITERAPGRYAFHDLLRAYATELVREAERHPAQRRLLDHYLGTAYAAARLLDPHGDPIDLPPPAARMSTVDITAEGPALAWLTAEYPVLLAAVQSAATGGYDGHAWRLARALAEFFDRQGRWHDWIATHTTAVAAAERAGDRTGQAHTHRDLARAYGKFERYADARTHLERALALFAELDDRLAEATTHLNLGGLLGREGRHDESLAHATRALHLFRRADHPGGQARALNNIGWYLAQLGDHRAALARCRQALALLRELGDRRGEADTWDSLGFIQRHLGEHGEAAACYRNALDLYRAIGDRYGQADSLIGLGDALLAGGDAGAAREVWTRAVVALDELGHPSAETVRVRLANA